MLMVYLVTDAIAFGVFFFAFLWSGYRIPAVRGENICFKRWILFDFVFDADSQVAAEL